MSKPAEYLTLVFRATDYARGLCHHNDCLAMSWSHALTDRDGLEDENDALRAERDGLRAALIRIHDLDVNCSQAEDREAWDQARAALGMQK